MKGAKIEQLDPEMAVEILQVHHSAVHEGKAPEFYSQDVLDAWSPAVTPEKIDNLRSRMKGDGAQGVIARIGEEAVGFGIFVPSKSMIGAIYVKAPFAGQGIGGLILKKLEEIALGKGCGKLCLDASLNAGNFYSKHGYMILEESFHALPSGLRMKCLKMQKNLGK